MAWTEHRRHARFLDLHVGVTWLVSPTKGPPARTPLFQVQVSFSRFAKPKLRETLVPCHAWPDWARCLTSAFVSFGVGRGMRPRAWRGGRTGARTREERANWGGEGIVQRCHMLLLVQMIMITQRFNDSTCWFKGSFGLHKMLDQHGRNK